MIKKINWDEQPEDAAKEVQNLIDQLVDAVNGILAAQEEYRQAYTEDIVPMLTPQNEEPEMAAENVQQRHHWDDNEVQRYGAVARGFKSLRKEPTDPYIEQRKWVGKLCKFEGENYGILKEIGCADTKHVWRDGAFRSSDGYWYDFCEPVKPDDDIIYKGGDNE